MLPPVRVQYHKARLEALKEKRDRFMGAQLNALDKFWLQLTGRPMSAEALTRGIATHESALVRLGFLDREELAASMVAECRETEATLTALEKECPWYHAETVAGTNLLVTACPDMMAVWRKRVKELGW